MSSSLSPHSLMIARTCSTGENYSAPPMASEMGQGLTAEMTTPPAETRRDTESYLGFCVLCLMA